MLAKLFCFVGHETTKLANEGNLEELKRHGSLYKCQAGFASIFGKVLIGAIKISLLPAGHG